MVRAALTGGIATGKSHCLARFAALGVPTVDADLLAREALAPGSPGLAAVAARFGPGVMQPDGTLDRPALAAIVFSDRNARAALEAIVHPEVRRRIREWFVSLPPQTPLAIADIPLLFETGQEHDFDRVIVCACDPAEQLRRLTARERLVRGGRATAPRRTVADLREGREGALRDQDRWDVRRDRGAGQDGIRNSEC